MRTSPLVLLSFLRNSERSQSANWCTHSFLIRNTLSSFGWVRSFTCRHKPRSQTECSGSWPLCKATTCELNLNVATPPTPVCEMQPAQQQHSSSSSSRLNFPNSFLPDPTRSQWLQPWTHLSPTDTNTVSHPERLPLSLQHPQTALKYPQY